MAFRTEISLEIVENTAALGLSSWKSIATACGCSTDTLEAIRKSDNGAVEEARRKGMAKAAAIVATALMERCKAGDVQAIKLWSSHCLGWHHHNQKTEGQGARPSIVINLTQAPVQQVGAVVIDGDAVRLGAAPS
jgi:hypothetical protein